MLFCLSQEFLHRLKKMPILKRSTMKEFFFLTLLLFPISSFCLKARGQVKEIPFIKNQIIDLKLCLFTVSQIQLAEGEIIQSIQNGDKMAWQIDVDTNLNNSVFIKPILAGSSTNLIILTTKRSYYFSLHSFSGNNRVNNALQWYALKFVYPKKEFQKPSATIHETPIYQWKYSYHGPRYLMPKAVFDDGRITYFQLKANQSLPSLFAVESKKGNESVVNFRREGDYLIVYQVAPQFTLRWKNGEVGSVFNETWIRNSYAASSSAQ